MSAKPVRDSIATWWRISDYSPEIEPLPVVAFTKSFVTYLRKQWTFSGPDRFEERRGKRDDILPTFAEAKEKLIRIAEAHVKATREGLQQLAHVSETGSVSKRAGKC